MPVYDVSIIEDGVTYHSNQFRFRRVGGINILDAPHVRGYL